MVYGLIFDNFPIFKKHDKPYMILSVVISTLGFLGLRFEFFSDTPASTALCFWLALMGMAMSDVIADSMVVKQARDAGLDGGANLQTFCWIMSSVGSIIGALLGGLYTFTGIINLVASFFFQEMKGDVTWSMSRVNEQIIKLLRAILLNKTVLVPMLWIILSAAAVPDVSSAMNFWKMMSLSNTGGSLSAFWGGHLMNALHIVKLPVDNNNTSALLMEEEYDFSQLPTALWIRVVGMIIPAFLALIMLPNTNVMEAYEEKNNAEFVELRNILFSEDLDNDSTLFDVKTSLEIIDEFDEIPLLSCKRQAF
ncbi:hypothetical protein HK099_004918 [Clydaea vesicula]|uniref:Uncharacterized protein n=1 Tax=Clydaea vesicula TaxID=447962 RepID=A0AAD5TZN2_9FUNG|nr:hypothetical protein HK099_004918 [Clydaea vesicula]